MKITTHVTIPMPRATTHVFKGYKLDPSDRLRVSTIRILDSEKAEIAATAAKINLTYSEFVRWCALYTAREVEKELMLSEYK